MRCVQNVGIDFLFYLFQASELFYHIPKDSESNDIINLIKERRMSRVISLHPVTDPLVMYKMHRYYTELELNRTFVETRTLQNVIKDMLPYLPDGKLTSCRFTLSHSYQRVNNINKYWLLYYNITGDMLLLNFAAEVTKFPWQCLAQNFSLQ